jgi:hypothetical protein
MYSYNYCRSLDVSSAPPGHHQKGCARKHYGRFIMEQNDHARQSAQRFPNWKVYSNHGWDNNTTMNGWSPIWRHCTSPLYTTKGTQFMVQDENKVLRWYPRRISIFYFCFLRHHYSPPTRRSTTSPEKFYPRHLEKLRQKPFSSVKIVAHRNSHKSLVETWSAKPCGLSLSKPSHDCTFSLDSIHHLVEWDCVKFGQNVGTGAWCVNFGRIQHHRT